MAIAPQAPTFDNLYKNYKDIRKYYGTNVSAFPIANRDLVIAYNELRTFVDQNEGFGERFRKVKSPEQVLTAIFNKRLKAFKACLESQSIEPREHLMLFLHLHP